MEKIIYETYKEGEFKDYKGEIHKVIVCGLIVNQNDRVTMSYDEKGFDNDDESVIKSGIYIGYSICNPLDEYSLEVGKKIAHSKAFSGNAKMWASKKVLVKESIVDSMAESECENICKNPQIFIRGYKEYYANWIEKQNLSKAKEDLNSSESIIYEYLKDKAENNDKSGLDIINKIIDFEIRKKCVL